MPRPFHSRPHRVNEFPTRAFFAFSVALAASAWALFAEIGKPYAPSIPILFYTLYLYSNRDKVGQQESDALKDSPYFLGFLLTMFGLFKIFNDVSFNFALFGRNPELMTEEVGGAVLTTIVGLFSRQALLGLVRDESPAEDDRLAALANAVTSHAVAFEVARQQFFREMAEERTKQARDLETTQERFLARLDDLTRSVPIIGGPPAHSEAGYSLAERPGAIVVGATPRPTVGFTAGVPSSSRDPEVRRPIETAGPIAGVRSAATVPQAPRMMADKSLDVTIVASTTSPAVDRSVQVVATTSTPTPAEPVVLRPFEPVAAVVLRPFEPVAALVTPPPSSGKTPADWIVATSRPETSSAAPMATPTTMPTVGADDSRAERSRATSTIAAPYVRPSRGTPGYGDVT